MNENVVYETVKPRYMVERNDNQYNYYTQEAYWGRWEADKGFAGLDDAREYADDQQAIFPDAKFRVVDNEA